MAKNNFWKDTKLGFILTNLLVAIAVVAVAIIVLLVCLRNYTEHNIEIDVPNITELYLEEAKIIHLSGITPALSDNMVQACLEACKKAKEKGVMISCDLNYRKKLWSREKAGEVMSQLMPYVDVCIANEEDAADVFGIHAEHTDIEGGKLDYSAYESVARQLSSRFGCKKVAITLRGSISASENTWAGMLYDKETDKAVLSRSYHILIVDRVGGGDSFGGGLIYALSQGYNDQDAINFAVAASCLKHTIEHDFNQVKVDEVLALMNGSGSGRVQR